MTITSSTIRDDYLGNGVTTVYPYTFKVLAASEVTVYLDDVLQATGYSVSGVGDEGGGNVTFTTAPGAGIDVALISVTPRTQETDYVENDPFPAQSVEDALDKLTKITLEHDEDLTHVIRTPVAEAPGIVTVPTTTLRANKYFTWDSSGQPTATDAASASGTSVTSTGSTTARLLADRFAEVYNIQDFGAVGDGVTDCLIPITAALATGKAVHIPEGDWLVSATIPMLNHNQTVFGDGPQSRILTNSATADVFTIGNGTDEIRNLLFRNFSIWSTVTKSAGFAFNARFAVRSRWENVWLGRLEDYGADGNRLWNGYYFNRFDHVVIESGGIAVQNNGLQARGDSAGLSGAELILEGGWRIAYCAIGLLFGGACGGIRVDEGDISICTTAGIRFDRSLQAGVQNREAFFGSKLSVDSCTNYGMDITGNSLFLLDLAGTWLSANNVGLHIDTTETTVVKAVGAIMYLNQSSGVEANGSGELHITGGDYSVNGQGASGGHGIHLPTGSALSVFSIVGARITANGNVTKGNGVFIAATCNIFRVTNNTLLSNGQAAVQNDAGNSVNQIVRDNIGYVTENSGLATILSGTALVVVGHGMDETPSSVVITARDSHPESVPWVSDIGATTFTIRINSSAGANRAFHWRAALLGA